MAPRLAVPAVLLVAYAGALMTSNPLDSRRHGEQRPRRTVVVEGGRTATPLGRVTTPDGKRQRVQELSTAIDDAAMIFSFKGEGLDIKVINDLRVKLPETSKAAIAKNKLMRLAGSSSGWTEETLESSAHMFKGSNMWIFSGDDMKGTIKAYNAWIKDNGLKESGYEIRGGYLQGSHLDEKGVQAAVDLPTKPELMARLAGAINLAGPLGLATSIKNAKGNPQGLAVRLKKAAGGKLAVALKVSRAPSPLGSSVSSLLASRVRAVVRRRRGEEPERVRRRRNVNLCPPRCEIAALCKRDHSQWSGWVTSRSMVSRTMRSSTVLWSISVVSSLVVCVVRWSWFPRTPWLELLAGEPSSEAQQFPSTDWVVAKYTLALAAGSIEDVARLATTYLCEAKTRCLSDLGCGSERAWCTINAPYASAEFGGDSFELHWVEAPRLNDLRANGTSLLDDWIRSWDASPRSAFGQNKIQLYASDLRVYARQLPEDVVAYRRSSLDRNGERVAHIGVDLGNRAYELVGRLDDVVREPWRPDECPRAQVLASSLADLEALNLTGSFDGRPRLVFVAASAATSDLALQRQFFDHVSRLSSAEISIDDADGCVVATVRWTSMPSIAFRYVVNRRAFDAARVAAFDAFALREHQTFFDRRYLSWDRLLDQHVGLYYSGDATDCDARAKVTKRLLREDGRLAVAERQEPDAHELYVGYAGAVTWQYQFGNCDAGRPDAPSECACSSDNNLEAFLARTGATSCLNYSLGDEGSDCTLE